MKLGNGNPFPNVDMKQVYSDLNIELPDDIYGGEDSLIRNWNEEQMLEYIETGKFPRVKTSNVVDEVTPRTMNHGF